MPIFSKNVISLEQHYSKNTALAMKNPIFNRKLKYCHHF